MVVDHPERVRRAVVLDICLPHAVHVRPDEPGLCDATGCFHWFFLIQPSPLPETLISAAPLRLAELYLGATMRETFGPECFELCASQFADANTLRAVCNDSTGPPLP